MEIIVSLKLLFDTFEDMVEFGGPQWFMADNTEMSCGDDQGNAEVGLNYRHQGIHYSVGRPDHSLNLEM